MVYVGDMKKPRRNHKKQETQFPASAKARWLPGDNTRAATFADRRAVARKRMCRGKVTAWD